jgi:hypothetical protein
MARRKKSDKNIVTVIKKTKLRHPEEADDEYFIGNVGSLAAFGSIGWATKRIGKTAYMEDNVTPSQNKKASPVFIKREEVLKKSALNAILGINDPGWLVRMYEA